MKERLYALAAALLLIAVTSACSAFTNSDDLITLHTKQTSESAVEVPNVQIITEPEDETGISSVLSDQTIAFNGQGLSGFNYKSGGDSETVRVRVKNSNKKPVNYKLISPTDITWVQAKLGAGENTTYEHIFGPHLEGNWEMRFDTDDGSKATVELEVQTAKSPSI
ncbi:MAG: hypothetical protein KID09_07805 [Paenibacillus macerans]|uniref:hypothetical protein n=1 Tax=Paenibacillus macerans TaxID=44252 RepID=UPI00242AE71C|nr:hypothetical protein [Paenibacillus macerans]MBS5910545.1 hypothetical protein [Paenibacillus macerans]MDU5945560.1 hypothetical protein [Paenibacillus macerans]